MISLACTVGGLLFKGTLLLLKGKTLYDVVVITDKVIEKKERSTADVVNGVAQVTFGILQTVSMVEPLVGATHLVTILTTAGTAVADATRKGSNAFAKKGNLDGGDIVDVALAIALKGADIGSSEIAEHASHLTSCGAWGCENKEVLSAGLDIVQVAISGTDTYRNFNEPSDSGSSANKGQSPSPQVPPTAILSSSSNLVALAKDLEENVTQLQVQDQLHQEYAKTWQEQTAIPESIAVLLDIPRCQLSGKPIRYLVLYHDWNCDKYEVRKWLIEKPGIKPPNWPGENPPTSADFVDASAAIQEKCIDSQLREWASYQ